MQTKEDMQKATAKPEYFCSNAKGKMILMSYIMRYILIIFITCQLLGKTKKNDRKR